VIRGSCDIFPSSWSFSVDVERSHPDDDEYDDGEAAPSKFRDKLVALPREACRGLGVEWDYPSSRCVAAVAEFVRSRPELLALELDPLDPSPYQNFRGMHDVTAAVGAHPRLRVVSLGGTTWTDVARVSGCWMVAQSGWQPCWSPEAYCPLAITRAGECVASWLVRVVRLGKWLGGTRRLPVAPGRAPAPSPRRRLPFSFLPTPCRPAWRCGPGCRAFPGLVPLVGRRSPRGAARGVVHGVHSALRLACGLMQRCSRSGRDQQELLWHISCCTPRACGFHPEVNEAWRGFDLPEKRRG